jgi:thiamine-phosphate diphosphorylase
MAARPFVQYRNKIAPRPLRRAQAAEMLRICRAAGARLIINDDVWLAVEIGADGAHLGRGDAPGGSLLAAREALGPKRILGVSCYNDLAMAEEAAKAGADYIAFGSMFPSRTKPDSGARAAGTAGRSQRRFGLPVAAIGGITLDNAPQLIDAGADMLAVVSDLFDAMDIKARAEAYQNLFAAEQVKRRGFAGGRRRPFLNRLLTSRPCHATKTCFPAPRKPFPGGVNSPVRAFRSVGGAPRFFARGEGSRVWDADGKAYLDYVGSWGPLILGHADPDTVVPCSRRRPRAFPSARRPRLRSNWPSCWWQRVPSMDMVRLVSSGTEATMSAIRLARGFTGRDVIVKFEGCYHGHGDSLLVKAGSGLLTFGNPSSAGVPADLAQHTLVLDYNDAQGLADAFAKHGKTIACVIVEPVAGNMNLIAPKPEFLGRDARACARGTARC